MQSKIRQYAYGVLAVAGVVATWYFNLRFMGEQAGFDVAAFLAGGYANAAASSFTNDLMIGVPYEDFGPVVDVGYLQVIYGAYGVPALSGGRNEGFAGRAAQRNTVYVPGGQRAAMRTSRAAI